MSGEKKVEGKAAPVTQAAGPAALYDKKLLVPENTGCVFCGPDVPRAPNKATCDRCDAQMKGLPHMGGAI